MSAVNRYILCAMVLRPRFVLLAVVLFLMAGCSVRLHGNQSAHNGSTTTTTAGAVSGSAKFAGGKVAFSAGQVPAPGAPGGQVRFSGNAAVALLGVVVLADLVNYIVGDRPPKPLAPGTRIADTCSCYEKSVPATRQ